MNDILVLVAFFFFIILFIIGLLWVLVQALSLSADGKPELDEPGAGK